MKRADRAVLQYIQNRDPDGHPTEPTDLDRAKFKGWVIESFGYSTWEDYTGIW